MEEEEEKRERLLSIEMNSINNSEGLFPEIKDIITSQIAEPNIINIYPQDDSFSKLENDMQKHSCCLKGVYKRWVKLNIENKITNPINEVKLTLYKNNKLLICEYCKNKCVPKSKKKLKTQIINLTELMHNSCECNNFEEHRQIGEPRKSLVEMYTRTLSTHESNEITRIADVYLEKEDLKFLEEEMGKINNESILLGVFNEIFFKAAIKMFKERFEKKKFYVKPIIEDGIKIFEKFKFNYTKTNSKLKNKALLTYYLLVLLEGNYYIFSIERNILYETTASDFLFYSYIKKKKNILENEKVEKIFKNVNLHQLNDSFFDEIEKFNKFKKTAVVSEDYHPINFFYENCFFNYEYFQQNSNKPKVQELQFKDNSFNAAACINENNLLEIFDDFMAEKNKNDKEKLLFINKDNFLSNQLLEKILNKILNNTNEKNSLFNSTLFITGYLNFESCFKDIDKQKIIKLLDSYIEKPSSNNEEFKYLKTLQEIFDKIKDKINQINQSKREVKNFQYLPMIKRTLELFDVNDLNIKNMKNMDFSSLISELIKNLIIEKIASEFKKINNFSEYYKNILQIVYLFCINDEGKDYLYNSSLMQEVIDIIISKTKYDNDDKKYCEYFVELITILKLNFNRKIISRTFSDICGKDNKKVLLKLFFISDPIKLDQAIFDFSKYLNLLNKIENYNTLFEKDKLDSIEKIFTNNKNKYISFTEGIKYICTDNFESEKFDFIYDAGKFRKDTEENRYYFCSLMICLNNLLKTNFFIHKNKLNSFTQDKSNKYDLKSFILSEKIPFFAKSLILDYILKINIVHQVDKDNNTIGIFPYDDPKLSELIDKENKSNLENIIMLFNIYNIAIQLLFQIEEEEFKLAFIEQNGLYDFCFSILKAIYCFCNYVNNRLEVIFAQSNFGIHYCFYFSNLIYNFLQTEKKFSFCFNININNESAKTLQQKINKELSNNYEKSSKLYSIWKQNIFNNFQKSIKKYFEIMTKNLNNLSSSNIKSNIYNRYTDFNNGSLFSVNSNDAYSYLFCYKTPEIKENELIPDDNIGLYKDVKKEILANFKKWNNFVNKQSLDCGIDIVLNSFNMKFEDHTIREYFFAKYFLKIIPDNFDEYFNDPVVLNGFIKLINNDKNLINFENLEKKQDILEKYFEEGESKNLSEIKLKIIGTLIRKLSYTCNYEMSISSCFFNSEHEMQLSEYVNSLILFIQVLGENYNGEFHEAMFEYLYDLENEIELQVKNNTNRNVEKRDKRLPIAKYDEITNKYIPIDGVNISEGEIPLQIGDVDISQGCSGYLLLIILYKKIFDQIYKDNGDIIYENNLLILSHSLSTCLEEFSHINNDKHKTILNDCLKILFNDTKTRLIIINNDLSKLKKDPKLNFILNDLLNLLIAYIRNDSKNLISFYKGTDKYISIEHCKFEWIAVEYFKQTLEEIGIIKGNKEFNINDIDASLAKLELNYKIKRLNNIPEFHLALKYFEIINILINEYKISEFEFLLNKNIRQEDTDLANYISKSTEKNGMQFCQYENKDNMKELRKLMYTFINKIFINLEIIIDEEQNPKNISAILKSEINYLSQETKTDYENEVDRSSKDTKLLSIYQNLDRFLFEMIYNEHKKQNDPLNYDYLEIINFCFILLYNIILLFLNYKSPGLNKEEYNEIDNKRYSVANSIILIILTIIHLAYLVFILFNWYKNHLKIRYFYDLNNLYIATKGDIKLEEQLPLKKKSKLFKELIKNYSDELSRIEEFYPGIPKSKKRHILFIHTILLNSKIISFLITFTCIIFYYLISQIFLSLPILLFAKFIPTLSAIFSSLIGKFKYIFAVYIYTFCVLYIFGFSAFLFLPKMFNREVVNKDNEPISEEDSTEAICSSFWQCTLYFLNFGFKDGTGMDIISYRENVKYYYIQFFYESLFFLLISNIFGNIFTALITDAFSENRELVWNNEIDKKEVCFICQMDKNDCIDKHEDFKQHREKHSLWKYVSFLSNIILKEQSEFSMEEKYIWDKMKEQSFDWYPKKEEEDDDVKQLIKENIRDLEEKVNKLDILEEKIDNIMDSLSIMKQEISDIKRNSNIN